MNSSPPPGGHWMPATPDDALGPTVRQTVSVDDRSFILTRPDAVDRLMEHPGMPAVGVADEYMPFWADLWPAARMLARVILREPWPAGLQALELGCGLGLAGIAALARGLRVIFSDYDATSLRYAADNARINGFSDFQLLQLDWRWPPEDLRVPVILGSDLIYQLRLVPPLAALVKRVLAPGGLCLLMEQDRFQQEALQEAFRSEGLTFTSEVVREEQEQERSFKGMLYRIRG